MLMIQNVHKSRDSLDVMSVLVYVEVPIEVLSKLEDGSPDSYRLL